MNSFQAVSARIGVLRLDDLGALAGEGMSATVLALNAVGVPVLVQVSFTEKWGGRGWQRALRCPQCGAAARVLAINDDVAACGRCKRRRTPQSRQKNVRAWREGELADQLARAVLRGRPEVLPLRATTRRLERRAIAQADACIALAVGAVRHADRALRGQNG